MSETTNLATIRVAMKVKQILTFHHKGIKNEINLQTSSQRNQK
jgi:hypothetical protein